jgi:hypothetical protein
MFYVSFDPHFMYCTFCTALNNECNQKLILRAGLDYVFNRFCPANGNRKNVIWNVQKRICGFTNSFRIRLMQVDKSQIFSKYPVPSCCLLHVFIYIYINSLGQHMCSGNIYFYVWLSLLLLKWVSFSFPWIRPLLDGALSNRYGTLVYPCCNPFLRLKKPNLILYILLTLFQLHG